MTSDAAATAPPSLYKYVTIDVLKRILGGSIRFTQPGAFNDPFELLPEIVMPIGEPPRDFSLSLNIMAPRRNEPEGHVEFVPDGHYSGDATARSIVEKLNAAVGILCLSKISDSLLMWSHYAGQYGGAVIDFDASHEFFAGQIDVEYRQVRPKKQLRVFTDTAEPLPIAELCAKSDQWQYEREVRIVRSLAECECVSTDGRGFPVFVRRVPPEAIKSVTLGERTAVSEQKEIYACLKDTRTALALATINEAGYGFRREIIKYGVPASQVGPVMSPRTAHIFSDLATPRGEFARWLIEQHPLSKIVNKTV